MTTEPLDRIAELGAELQGLVSEMRETLDEYSRALKENPYSSPSMSRAKLCEARILGIATELRVIVAGNQSA